MSFLCNDHSFLHLSSFQINASLNTYVTTLLLLKLYFVLLLFQIFLSSLRTSYPLFCLISLPRLTKPNKWCLSYWSESRWHCKLRRVSKVSTILAQFTGVRVPKSTKHSAVVQGQKLLQNNKGSFGKQFHAIKFCNSFLVR
jgi:hypothetical protein